MTGDIPEVEISDREREILQLVATGATNQQIAQQLSISINTVKVHLRNINSKLGVTSRTEASHYAVRKGWISIEGEEAALSDEASDAADAAAETADAADALPPASRPDAADETPQTATAALPPAQPAHSLPRRAVLLMSGVALVVVAVVAVVAFLAGVSAQSEPPEPVASGTVEGDVQPWRELADMPAPRVGFALAFLSSGENEYLYVIGGEDNEQAAQDTVWRYDIAANSWEPRSPKPTAVADVMGVVVDGQIYVPGGRLASDAISDALEVYDPRSDSWQSGPALPAPRSGYALAAVEGRIYLFGGWDGTTYRDEVWQYDPDQDSWNVMSPMLTPRAFAGATALDGRIFILGGENASGRLDFNESYSPAEDRNGIDPWLTHGRISESRSRPAVAQSGELLLLFGGEGARAPLLVYNRRIERWQPQNDVPLPPLSGLRAVESSNVFYVLGGRTDEAASEKVFRYRALYTVFIPLPAN